MQPRAVMRFVALAAGLVPALMILWAVPAAAQLQVTPEFSTTPSKTVTPWVFQMAIGAVIIGVLAVVLVAVGYLRFAPRFFGRKEPAPPPPGTRPAMLARQAAERVPVGATRPAASAAPPAAPAAAPPAQEAPAEAPTAEAAAPSPAEAEAPSAEAQPEPAPATEGEEAAAASAAPTAGPQGEPAVQADAVGEAEAGAPEPAEASAGAEAPAEAAAQAAPAPAQQPAPAAQTRSDMDQETYDRVLEEQLGKGVDRRVAEGRARAAAVVAARKKAQG